MHISDYPIAEVVPHAATMSLLDAILDGGEDWLRARASIPADSPFAGPGSDSIPAWVGIEYMAQTIAAWAGVQARQRGEAVKIGFLVGTRRYEPDGPTLPLGSELEIYVHQQLAGENGLGAFECQLTATAPDGQQYQARATLNVFQPDNVEVFLEDNS
ncbi:hotdog family protein [Pseudomaricurvus sp. HS19]|uniref:ApeP family dehydratase n=1 Tax=Pseudomaricurvus sp. HS19 TaxID=2692626 RepID=UPI00136F61E0|nr:hotdog family protein [Pseudomaricurvus sp. HS19]MYM63973.1 3-hydroxylacyl-ACP dehydratase [Pseudomaricurvus sp. HS19]